MGRTRIARRALFLAALVASFVACDGATFRCDPSPSWSVHDEPHDDAGGGAGGFCAGRCRVGDVALGDRHTCVSVGVLGEVVCFGANEEGQSSPATRSRETLPVAVQQRSDEHLGAGAIASCAQHSEALVCWGSAAMFGNSDAPVVVAASNVESFDVGSAHVAVAVWPPLGGLASYTLGAWDGFSPTRAGSLAEPVSWPSDDEQVVGAAGFWTWFRARQTTSDPVFVRYGGVPPPGALASGNRWTRVEIARANVPGNSLAAGALHACAEGGPEGRIMCQGDDSRGQLGRGAPGPHSHELVPLPEFTVQLSLHRPCVGGHLDVRVRDGAVVVGEPRGGHSCARSVADEVWCWGANDRGQLGDGTLSDRATPVRVAGLPSVHRLACGGEHTCAVTDAGELWCWGDNSFGQLGVPSSELSLRAVAARVDVLPAGAR